MNNEIIGTDVLPILTIVLMRCSFIWMNVDQNLFKADSRGNSCPFNWQRNGSQGEVLTEVKSNP
jgi:hypothetical protein